MTGVASSADVAPDARSSANALSNAAPANPALIRSGIRPLDYRLGGMLPNRPHVVSGNPGTGKSVSCLEFAASGLESGEKVLLITHDDPADVLASAAFLGIDIDTPLREERLILLRYQLDFVRRMGRATSPDAVFQELRRTVSPFRFGRVAIDSIVPFLDGGPGSATAIYGLIQLLDALETTSLLTFPGDMTGLYDRRLEPLMQRAAGVFHLSCDSERNHSLEVRKIRYDAPSTRPVSFRIMAGAGMVVITDVDASTPAEPPELQRRLLLINMAEPLAPELLATMRQQFEVEVRTGMFSAFSEVARDGLGALLLNVRRDVMESSLQLIRDMRKSNSTVPVVLVTPYVLRSADRTRALRAGADDFLSTTLPPAEMLARLEHTVRRGHWHDLITPMSEPPLILQPTSDGSVYEPMRGDALKQSIRAHFDQAQVPYFTLFVLRPEKGTPEALARLVLDVVRVESGDLVGVLEDGRVVAYLDGARPKDLASLKVRLREHAYRLGSGEIDIEAMGYPANEGDVRALIGTAGES